MSANSAAIAGLFAKINALDDCRSVPELMKKLRPILLELAYNAAGSEAGVLAYQEEWHGDFTSALYSDHAEDAPRAVAPGGPPSYPSGSGGSRAPPPRRPAVGSLPPSLRSIYEGTHASFRDPHA